MAWFARLVYFSRIAQILLSAIMIGLSIPLSHFIYSGTNPFFAATASSAAIVLLNGCIGFFAFKRPNDVHWHLTLTLDWLAALLSLALCVIFTMFTAASDGADYLFKWNWGRIILAATALSYPLLCATFVPVVWTHWLKRKARLPPPSSKRDYWYHMEDQPTASRQQDGAVP